MDFQNLILKLVIIILVLLVHIINLQVFKINYKDN